MALKWTDTLDIAIELDEAHPDAAPAEWGIEMDNPLGLSRHGWKPGSLKPGDRVVVVPFVQRGGEQQDQVVPLSRGPGFARHPAREPRG